MSETIIAKATLRHVRREWKGQPIDYLEATAQLYQLNGNPLPHFSLTGTEKDKHGESGGCIHDRLLAQWPQLAPLAAIHLSDSEGVPMHAVENGWYWAGGCREWNQGKPNDPPNIQFLANHLRIPIEHAEKIVLAVKDSQLTKAGFAEIVETYKPRWKHEAKAAVELIRSLNSTEAL